MGKIVSINQKYYSYTEEDKIEYEAEERNEEIRLKNLIKKYSQISETSILVKEYEKTKEEINVACKQMELKLNNKEKINDEDVEDSFYKCLVLGKKLSNVRERMEKSIEEYENSHKLRII